MSEPIKEPVVERAYRHGYHHFKAYMFEGLYEGFSPSLDVDDLAYNAIDVAIRSGDEIKDNRYINMIIEYEDPRASTLQHTKTMRRREVTVVVSHVLRVEVTEIKETA
jgi:hypothetical protein